MGSDLGMNTPMILHNDQMESPLLIGDNCDIDPILFSRVQKKRIMKSVDELPNKKKKFANKDYSPVIKKLIQEFSTDDPENEKTLQSESASKSNTSVNFLNLYQKSNKYPKRTSEGKVAENRFQIQLVKAYFERQKQGS
ncbi:9651_t:CDS:2 [Acaulospora morrowiae]|uniref:9651_t:CDS:1 n=1 Tax=Acaulospora morrowiae TaxID=94023 RepID=A0A9N9B7N3_9GLOM|nr:9651_t:CDS:2 [Acaulospora morrowiae]